MSASSDIPIDLKHICLLTSPLDRTEPECANPMPLPDLGSGNEIVPKRMDCLAHFVSVRKPQGRNYIHPEVRKESLAAGSAKDLLQARVPLLSSEDR